MTRNWLNLRQALILLLVGAVVGYPSWVAFEAPNDAASQGGWWRAS